MFTSSLSSVLGERSALGFKRNKRVLVVFIDGLGAENVLARAGHAPWLAREIQQGASSYAAFPSTTSANIASFATGLMPGEHGIVGHVVRDSHHNHAMNLLNGWDHRADPRVWQPNQTVSEKAFERGVNCNVIAAEEYRATGFTEATMRKANFISADSISQRFARALEILQLPGESINYLYIPELDKWGHVQGWQSAGWAALLEEVAAEIDKLRRRIPADTGVVITADHGMIDSPESDRIELSQVLSNYEIEFFGGDPRSAYVYLAAESDVHKVIQELSNDVRFLVNQTINFQPWLGEIGEQARHRLPDLMLSANGSRTLFHEAFSKPRSYLMASHHGGFSSAELRIPLVRVGI